MRALIKVEMLLEAVARGGNLTRTASLCLSNGASA